MAAAWRAWRQVEQARQQTEQDSQRARAEEEYLRHARAELDALDPSVGEEERLAERSEELGAWLLYELRSIRHPHIREVRGKGLLIGLDLMVPARAYCERLKEMGMLCKETHDYVIRLAPPLVISQDDLEWMVATLRNASRRSGANVPRALQAPLNSSMLAMRFSKRGVIRNVFVLIIRQQYTY